MKEYLARWGKIDKVKVEFNLHYKRNLNDTRYLDFC